MTVERRQPHAIDVVEVNHATAYRGVVELLADPIGVPAPSAHQHEVAPIAPFDQQTEGPEDSHHILARFEGGDEEQVARRHPVGCAVVSLHEAGIDPLVDRPHDAPIGAETVDELTGGGFGDRDQPVGVEQGAGKVPVEPVQGRRRHGFRHGDEGEIVNRRYLGSAKRFLVAVEKKVGRKENGVAVEGA